MKRILLATTILIFITSCGILPNKKAMDLSGTSWRLTSFGGKTPLSGKDMTANFDSKEINGSASCNHYFGSYKLKKDQITISELGWTEMACLDPEGIMKQEQIIMKMLSESDTFTIQGDRLQITTSSGDFLIFQQLIGVD